MGMFHLILQIPFWIHLFTFSLSSFAVQETANRYFSNTETDIFSENTFPIALTITFAIFTIGQLIFLTNILIGLVKKLKSPRN
jgi:hypothetical protein